MYDYDDTEEEQFTEETLQEGLRQHGNLLGKPAGTVLLRGRSHDKQ